MKRRLEKRVNILGATPLLLCVCTATCSDSGCWWTNTFANTYAYDLAFSNRNSTSSGTISVD